MNKTQLRRGWIALTLTAAALELPAQTPPEAGPPAEEITRLQEFIAEETAVDRTGNVLPTSRPVDSVFGSLSVLEVPRSVTVLTPELMRQFNINSFADLAKIGTGTQQTNYYGVPGSPTLRGAKGGVFFDGIQRAWQRNEMPLSFGSLEAMDVVKGPAPAHYGASQVGGYSNLIPKSPYFDKFRGSVKLTVGDDDFYNLQTDVGGPTLLFGKPAAYRVSLTGQLAGSYWDRIRNDYVSLYASLKARVADGVTVFTGGEYFQFRSNENAGWNRPTQNLIDSGKYVIGEPLSIVSSEWGGVANRNALYTSTALVVPAAIVDAGVSSNFISSAQRAQMLNLADPAQRATAYAGFSASTLASIAQSTSGYLYTPAYFTAGGKVFTADIEGSSVLSDDNDFADSENFLYFFGIENTRNPDRTYKGQFLLDAIETDKLSTYGYAIYTKQLVLEAKGTATQKIDFLKGMELTYGVSARFTDAKMLQDFFDEPFSRRDITREAVSANSIILTGAQTGPDGRNFWSPTAQGGANAQSELWQLSGFAYAENKILDVLTTYTSLLAAYAPYDTSYPEEVDLVPAADPRRTPVSDSRTYYSASFSPVLTVAPGVNLYGVAQYGTALDPLQGGAIVGKGNFSKQRLFEGGVKASLVDGRLFASLAGYTWKQTQFDERSNNAEPLKGRGVEFEMTFLPMEGLTIIASANYQKVQRESSLGFRTIPLSEQEWALYGGVLPNPFSGIRPASEFFVPANNPDLEYPGTPQTQVKLFVIYEFGNGIGVSGGPIWSEDYWHNFDHTLKLPSTTVWNFNAFYRVGAWDLMVSVENAFSEDYYLGADPVFAANTLLTKAPDATVKASVNFKF